MIQNRGYKYSPAGDIRQITNNLSDVTYTYTYDKLHRLKSETNDGTSDPFAPVMIESSFRAAAPLHAPDQIEFNGASFSYSYDENGNMTAGPDFTDPAQPAMRTITYNADNMPVTIVHEKGASSNTIEFVYDGENRRVKKVVNGVNETYYIGEHFEVRNGIETKYIFAGSLRIAKITSTNRYFCHKDHLGSSTVMTNYPYGEVVETTEYMPFGRERNQPGISLSRYKFTDQEWDNESGLYNYDARLYDPVIGRFISPDTLVPYPLNQHSLNRYSYVRNNPLRYIDPSGHADVDFGWDWDDSDDNNNSSKDEGDDSNGDESYWDIGYNSEPKKHIEIGYEPTCKSKLSNPKTMEAVRDVGNNLEEARKAIISGADRTKAQHQKLLGKKTKTPYGRTQHGSVQGYRAADVKYYDEDDNQIDPLEVGRAAKKVDNIGGIGIYNTFTHIDIRPRKPDGSGSWWDERTNK